MPAVRHLDWMCHAPALISSEARFEPAHYLPDDLATALTEWDRAPEQGPPILTETPSRRLGQYFERLYACMLEDLMGWQILLKNQPIRDRGLTLGELDFIVRNPRDQTVEHHEIAVKFYLGDNRTNPGSALWYGPNSKDRLDLKSARLLTHQSRLAEKPETRAILDSMGIPLPDRARIFMPGYLFYPAGQTLLPPADVPANHLHGEWLYLNEVEAFSDPGLRPEAAAERWVPLVKPHWLGPWSQTTEPYTRHALEALATVRTAGTPRLFALLRWCQQRHVWMESSRIFVVPDSWPEHRNGPGR